MVIKKLIQYSLLLALTSWYSYQIAYGKNGLKTYYRLQQQLQQEEANVAQLTQKIAQLEKHIHMVKANKFTKEKIAREELLLGKSNEYVYFVQP
jgi:cell division protein FtsB